MTLSTRFTKLGQVIADTRWWPFYLQRQFMQPALRGRIAQFVAARLRPPGNEAPEHNGASIAGDDVSVRLKELQSDGISHFGQLLTAAQVAELRSYFLAKPVFDPYRPATGKFLPDSPDKHPDSHVGHHEARDVVMAPYLIAMANRPEIIAIVRRFLNCQPTLCFAGAWWSYPTTVGAQQAEHFHRDVDDWRFVKFFIYLTDVGPGNGPHVYVKRSSPKPELREIRRFDDEEVIAAFGRENVIEVTGRAGEGFLEDTFGIHKGQPVVQGRRLIFQTVYSMFPLPYGPKTPVARLDEVPLFGGPPLDPWINRLYLH